MVYLIAFKYKLVCIPYKIWTCLNPNKEQFDPNKRQTPCTNRDGELRVLEKKINLHFHVCPTTNGCLLFQLLCVGKLYEDLS